MNEELNERFYRLLVECNAVEAFVALAKDMGEKAARTVAPMWGDPKAAFSAAYAQICYDLADGANGALADSEAKAKVEEADRIRREFGGE